MKDLPIGAYFYPLTTGCPVRKKRAKTFGHEIIDETQLVKRSKPRFEGHKIPKTYCLGKKEITCWDDSEYNTMDIQINLAKSHGIDFFVFDTYMGIRNGKFVQEMGEPLNKAFIREKRENSIKFALMIIPESPRVVLPVPKGYIESDRTYAMRKETAGKIVDFCVKNYWFRDDYFRINGKPYLSLYVSQLSVNNEKEKYLHQLVDAILSYAKKNYTLDLYMVGVITKKEQGSALVSAGAQALTGYANLPNFDSNAPYIQDYKKQLISKRGEWLEIADNVGVPFVPPAVTGWDSTPRGDPDLLFDQVKGYYPFTPIVINSSPKAFGKMLRETLVFTSKHVPKEEQYGLICAWNEITESMALLPTVQNGKVDFSYLEEVRKAREALTLIF